MEPGDGVRVLLGEPPREDTGRGVRLKPGGGPTRPGHADARLRRAPPEARDASTDGLEPPGRPGLSGRSAAGVARSPDAVGRGTFSHVAQVLVLSVGLWLHLLRVRFQFPVRAGEVRDPRPPAASKLRGAARMPVMQDRSGTKAQRPWPWCTLAPAQAPTEPEAKRNCNNETQKVMSGFPAPMQLQI